MLGRVLDDRLKLAASVPVRASVPVKAGDAGLIVTLTAETTVFVPAPEVTTPEDGFTAAMDCVTGGGDPLGPLRKRNAEAGLAAATAAAPVAINVRRRI